MTVRDRVRVGVIGVGYWGPNHVRNFAQAPGADLKAVCDLKVERLKEIHAHYPTVWVTSDLEDLLRDDAVEALVVAVPASLHYAVARRALEHDKHVLVEKPLAMSSNEARELIRLAEARGKVLMVGDTFQYNAAVRKVKALIRSGELGDIYYIFSQRLNLGQVRGDVDVMWNLAPHDVSIILDWFGEEPVRVIAKGLCFLKPPLSDVVMLTLDFPSGRSAFVMVSWLSPERVRKISVVGSQKMVVYDDVSVDAKVQIYDKGMDRTLNGAVVRDHTDFGEFQLLVRTGDLLVPKINFMEPLRLECEHFLECVRTGTRPLTDGESGLRVTRVLEAASVSLDRGGAPVMLEEVG